MKVIRIDNLILSNPNKRPHFDAFKEQIICGNTDPALLYKPLAFDKVLDTLKSIITPQFQLLLGALKDDEFRLLARRLTVIG